MRPLQPNFLDGVSSVKVKEILVQLQKDGFVDVKGAYVRRLYTLTKQNQIVVLSLYKWGGSRMDICREVEGDLIEETARNRKRLQQMYFDNYLMEEML